LDYLSCGLHASELTIVAAAPSIGKSAFLINLVRHITVEEGLPVFFASLEHTRLDVAERLLIAQARVDGHRLRKGTLKNDDSQRIFDAGRILQKAGLFIDESQRQNMLGIAASARKLRKEQGIRAVFIDCIDLIEPDNPRDSRFEQVAIIARRLKRLARELDIPVVASARLSRANPETQGHRPRIADLRQNIGVEQEADILIMLHRPERFDAGVEDGAEGNTIEVIVAKQRNGPTGVITLSYLKQFMRYENYAVGDDDPIDA
jgi:replicative DNA helicase